MDKSSKPFPTLGQRLAAAMISYQLGRPTVDGTLKQYVGGNLDPWWAAEIQKTPCIYCPHEVSYIIDFSRSVDSPKKRVAWRAPFLKSMGKDSAQEVIDASTLDEVKDEMDEPRQAASVRQALNV
jgi:hypothetical protein